MCNKEGFIKFLINSGVLTFGDFITKSGRKSPYFINTGNFETGKQLAVLGEFYARCIVDNIGKGLIPADVNVLFGPAYKGIPLSVATAISLEQKHGYNLHYCFNRKEEKDHGEGGKLVGHRLVDGDKILIIEDVITAGTAVRESVPMLRSLAHVEICGLILSVDRMEKGRGNISAVQEIYKDYQIPTFPIVNIKEIIGLLRTGESGLKVDSIEKIADSMDRYMDSYCII